MAGVPQRSVLGPLLFLIYIDGVNSVSLSPGSNLVLYADDNIMLLYGPILTPDDYTYLQADIDAIAQWTRNDINVGFISMLTQKPFSKLYLTG